MRVKFTHFCITQPQFRRCFLFWCLLEKELFILKKEYLMVKGQTQWLVKLSKLVPDTFFFGYYYERRSWLRGEYIRLPYWTSAYFCEVLETNIFVDEYIRLPSCEIPKYSTERLTNIFVIIGHTYHDWKYLFWSL